MDFSNVKKVFLPSRLPYGYQEVEYIESKKPTQYIDTGVSLRDYDQNLDITIDFQETYIGNIAVGLVSSGSYSGLYWFTFPEVASQSYYVQMAAGTWATISPKPSGRCLIKSNSKTGAVSVDDFSCTTTTQSFIDYANEHSITNNGNLYLFGANNLVNDNVSIGASRVYYALFKNATTGEKIKEFIPCYRTSDNKIGMFDLVTKSFYPSNGSGDFTVKGNDVTPDVEVVKIEIKTSVARLPSEYQEVEWIGGSGSQYINTGVTETSNASWELGGWFRLTHTKSDDKQSFYGTDSLNLEIKTNSTNTDTTTSVDFGINQWHNIVSNKNYTVSPYTVVKSLDDTQLQNSTSTYFRGGQFRLFASYYSYVFRIAKADCSEMYIKKDGELIRDFIPCYRKSDNEIGMYDLVDGGFYTNQGSDTFTKGNDVTSFSLTIWEKQEQ